MRVLERVLALLDVLAESETELGGAEVSRRLGLHKSTGHRLLTVLKANRYLEKSPETGKYRLGWKLVELGTRAAARMDLREMTRPHLERLAAQTGETAHLGVLQQGMVLSIAHAESGRTLRAPSTVGHRSPAHCSSQGKAMLAYLPAQTLRELIRTHPLKAFTRNTITRLSVLWAELEQIRAQGYAVDDEEIEAGLKCIGAPVRNNTGNVVAALSIAGPASRLSQDRMPELVRLVRRAAAGLSASLGYREQGGHK